MKKLIAISAIALVMTSCSSSVSAAEPTASAVAITQARVEGPNIIDKVVANAKQQKINKVISQVKSRVGKTWYVFSGASPAGWDCSGLTFWVYEQLGIKIPHSANKQGHLNKGVKDPKIGDIVLFGYKGTDSYYHAALYIGKGKIIHAGFRKGTFTQILSLKNPAFKGSTIKFVRPTKTL
jgi:cell wall-associated NlpC family hydrolase